MQANQNQRPPADPAIRRGAAHGRSVAIVKPYTLRFRAFDGVAGVESVMFEYRPANASPGGGSSTERVLGVMTEPIN